MALKVYNAHVFWNKENVSNLEFQVTSKRVIFFTMIDPIDPIWFIQATDPPIDQLDQLILQLIQLD